MSDTTTKPLVANETPDGEKRPWHGVTNPLEALWIHFSSELSKAGTNVTEMAALKDRVTALETEVRDLKAQKPAPVVAAPVTPPKSPTPAAPIQPSSTLSAG